jgi:hypothetical protein
VTPDYDSWRGPARALAVGVDAAVTAADAADPVAFDDALADLRTLDRGQLQVLLGTANQELLERAAPDGLDAEEAERVLSGCLRSAGTWYEPLDTAALLRAFTTGVGVDDPDDPDDEGPTVTPDAVLAHGLLLVAHLRTVTRAELPEVLDHALGELRRAQTMELP